GSGHVAQRLNHLLSSQLETCRLGSLHIDLNWLPESAKNAPRSGDRGANSRQRGKFAPQFVLNRKHVLLAVVLGLELNKDLSAIHTTASTTSTNRERHKINLRLTPEE